MITLLMLSLIGLNLACPDQDEYCASCSNNTCLLCYHSFVDSAGKCVESSKSVDNCMRYKSDGNCQKCEEKYYLSTDNSCKKITVENCLYLYDLNKCKICEEGYAPESNGGGSCIKVDKCMVDDCKKCGFDYVTKKPSCEHCKDGFALHQINQSFSCVKETDKTNNCQYLSNSNTQLCGICDFGYYWANGECKKSSKYSSQILMGLFSLLMSLMMF